ncbi:MAG TPA: FHA domain-containing protein [Longimicrobiales bacterium]|nr:FHA domain-containing protein [Longimicrobiales bacterium]
MAHCPTCGAAALPGHRFCTGCGSPLAQAAAATPPASAAPTGPLAAAVVHVLAAGERRHPLGDPLIIGRNQGQVQVPGDSFLSGRHASVQGYGGHYVLRDLGSRNGTYVRIRETLEMGPGDHVMVGSQVFRLDAGTTPGGAGREGPLPLPAAATRGLGADAGGGEAPRLVRLLEGGAEAERIPVPRSGLTVGRTRGDLVFPEDALVSGAHASFAPAPGSMPGAPRVTVTDLGSRNGVFVRIREDWRLRPGDVFSAGRQVFRFEG